MKKTGIVLLAGLALSTPGHGQQVVREWDAEVALDVDTAGQVAKVTLLTAVPKAIAEPAGAVMKHWRFKPVDKNGHTVAARTLCVRQTGGRPARSGYIRIEGRLRLQRAAVAPDGIAVSFLGRLFGTSGRGASSRGGRSARWTRRSGARDRIALCRQDPPDQLCSRAGDRAVASRPRVCRWQPHSDPRSDTGGELRQLEKRLRRVQAGAEAVAPAHCIRCSHSSRCRTKHGSEQSARATLSAARRLVPHQKVSRTGPTRSLRPRRRD